MFGFLTLVCFPLVLTTSQVSLPILFYFIIKNCMGGVVVTIMVVGEGN